MATKTLKGKFLPQYRTAAQWSAADSVLLRGEIGVESDTRKFKFGNGTTTWNSLGYAQSADTSGVTVPVRINEYGAIYDNGTFTNLPSGATVSWYVDNAGADGDMGPFKGEATAVWGIYIAIDGSEKPSSRSGMLVAYRADGEKGMATCYIYGTKEQGGVMNADDWAVYTHGDSAQNSLPFDGPIPGYELIYSDTTTGLELQNGVVAQFNFDKEIPSTQLLLSKSRLMVEAVIVSKSGSTQTIAASVPIAIIKPTLNNNIVFEYVAPTIASGSTSIPRVKLIITSWIRSGAYMTGCNVLLQVSNANASMGYHLMLQGVYVKSSGGTVADDEPEVPDEYFLTVDGKTATGDGFAVTSHSLDSTAQMLELAYTTNGTPQIAAIAGEFLSAQIVGEEAAETQATETSGTIQIEVPQNTGLLRSGSVTLSLAEDESVQCTISISQSGGGLT